MTKILTDRSWEQARLDAIKARVASIPDWFPETGNGAREIRIPPNPSRAQREFIACAPEDIRWLIQQVEAARVPTSGKAVREAPLELTQPEAETPTLVRPSPSKKK